MIPHYDTPGIPPGQGIDLANFSIFPLFNNSGFWVSPLATHRGAQMTPHYVYIPHGGRPTKWGIYQSKVEICHLSREIRWDNLTLLNFVFLKKCGKIKLRKILWNDEWSRFQLLLREFRPKKIVKSLEDWFFVHFSRRKSRERKTRQIRLRKNKSAIRNPYKSTQSEGGGKLSL